MTTKSAFLVMLEALEDTPCQFWACPGPSSGRIRSMRTCFVCRAIIIARRELQAVAAAYARAS